MPNFSNRFLSLPEYMLASIPQKKRELLARGVDVIDLGAGDADLPPPPRALEALERALRDPAMHRYGFQLGLPAARDLRHRRRAGGGGRVPLAVEDVQHGRVAPRVGGGADGRDQDDVED